MERTNAAIDREERIEAVEELKHLVEDWKGHRIEGFGDLLLYGQFTVLKGESLNAKDAEREVGSRFPSEQLSIRDRVKTSMGGDTVEWQQVSARLLVYPFH